MPLDIPAHQLQMTVLMTPDTANFSGKVHGGTLLKYLDQVAYVRFASVYKEFRDVNEFVDEISALVKNKPKNR